MTKILNNTTIFCDFDGTITNRDTVDHLLENYARPEWEIIEEEWKIGKIGSRECLERQIDCIENFSSNDLDKFINEVTIDENFPAFYQKVLEKKIPFFVISDGFDLIIQRIFKKYQLPMPTIYSNKLNLTSNKLASQFPMSNPGQCLVKAGMCKCAVIEKEKKNILYIGDGRSDLCASRLANILYAKGKLQTMCKEIGREFVAFSNFGEINKHLFL